MSGRGHQRMSTAEQIDYAIQLSMQGAMGGGGGGGGLGGMGGPPPSSSSGQRTFSQKDAQVKQKGGHNRMSTADQIDLAIQQSLAQASGGGGFGGAAPPPPQPAAGQKRGHQRMSTAEQIDLAIQQSLAASSGGGMGMGMAPVQEQKPASKPKRGHQRMSTAEQIDLAISMSLKDPGGAGGGKMGGGMAAIGEGGGDKWLCPMCTYTNPNPADVCEMCGTPKPPDAAPSAKKKKKKKKKTQNPSEWIAGSKLEVQLDDGSWVPGLVEGTKTSQNFKALVQVRYNEGKREQLKWHQRYSDKLRSIADGGGGGGKKAGKKGKGKKRRHRRQRSMSADGALPGGFLEDQKTQEQDKPLFSMGDRVRIKGLKRAIEYNDKTGQVIGRDMAAGRFKVLIDSSKDVIAVKPVNMGSLTMVQVDIIQTKTKDWKWRIASGIGQRSKFHSSPITITESSQIQFVLLLSNATDYYCYDATRQITPKGGLWSPRGVGRKQVEVWKKKDWRKDARKKHAFIILVNPDPAPPPPPPKEKKKKAAAQSRFNDSEVDHSRMTDSGSVPDRRVTVATSPPRKQAPSLPEIPKRRGSGGDKVKIVSSEYTKRDDAPKKKKRHARKTSSLPKELTQDMFGNVKKENDTGKLFSAMEEKEEEKAAIPEGNRNMMFRVDAPHGIAYRRSQNVKDRETATRGPEKDTVVEAVIITDKWIKINNGFWLPKFSAKGKKILISLADEDAENDAVEAKKKTVIDVDIAEQADSYKKEMESATQENGKLTTENEELKNKVEYMMETMKSGEQAIDDLNREKQDLLAQNERLSGDLEEVESNKLALESELEQMRQNAQNLRDTLAGGDRAQQKAEELESQLEEKLVENRNLKETWAAVRKSLEQEKSDLAAQLDQARHLMDAGEAEITTAQNKAQAAQEQYEMAMQRVEELDKERSELAANVEQMESSNTTMSNEAVQRMADEVDDYRMKFENSESQVDGLKSVNRNLEKKLGDLGGNRLDIQRLNRKLEDNERALNRKQRAYETLESDFNELQNEARELRNKASDSAGMVNSDEADQLRRQLRQMEGDQRSKESEIERQKREMSQMRSDLEEARSSSGGGGGGGGGGAGRYNYECNYNNGLNGGKSVRDWSVDESINWLTQNKLARYSDAFYRNNINGASLVTLDQRTMRNRLQVQRIHVKKFMRLIQVLQ